MWSVESPSLDYRPYLSTTVGVCSPEDGGTAVLANRSVVPSAVCLIPTSQGTTSYGGMSSNSLTRPA